KLIKNYDVLVGLPDISATLINGYLFGLYPLFVYKLLKFAALLLHQKVIPNPVQCHASFNHHFKKRRSWRLASERYITGLEYPIADDSIPRNIQRTVRSAILF